MTASPVIVVAVPNMVMVVVRIGGDDDSSIMVSGCHVCSPHQM
jgi:hypothetical protein